MSTRNVPSLWAPIVSLERFCDPGDPLETPQGSFRITLVRVTCGAESDGFPRDTCANMTHGSGDYASGRTAKLGDIDMSREHYSQPSRRGLRSVNLCAPHSFENYPRLPYRF